MGWGEGFEAQGESEGWYLEVTVSEVTSLTMSVKQAPDGDPLSNANGFQFAKILSKPQTSYLKLSPAPPIHIGTGLLAAKKSLSVV